MAWKLNKKFKWGLLIFFITWIILAQSCMKFRIDDNSATKEFAQKNLTVHFFTVK